MDKSNKNLWINIYFEYGLPDGTYHHIVLATYNRKIEFDGRIITCSNPMAKAHINCKDKTVYILYNRNLFKGKVKSIYLDTSVIDKTIEQGRIEIIEQINKLKKLKEEQYRRLKKIVDKL